MRTLYFDCFSGAAGDMILGALLDAGAPEAVVRNELESLQLPEWTLELTRTKRGNIAATKATVAVSDDGSERSYRSIRELLEQSALAPAVRERAARCFALLAEAEGKIHDQAPEDVHFHEAGSLDAIVDIVGSCAALEHFMPARVVTSPIAAGSGTVETGHGTLPVPVPAVTEILAGSGARVFARGEGELLTPTGAAILAAVSDDFGELPLLAPEACGYGAGSRDDTAIPNVVRVLVGAGPLDEPNDGGVVLIETNLDDMSPELMPYVIEVLLGAGAQDAWVTPIVMKKGRPALTLSVLAEASLCDALVEILYRETTTFGVRVTPVTKETASRRWIEVTVAGHPVRVKIATRAGEVMTVAPEYEDARRAARAGGLPLKEVYEQARRAAANEYVV